MEVARTSLLDIAYLTAGPVSGPPVILLHGWPDSASTWDEVTPALADAGHRVIMPFLRGFGPTNRNDPMTSAGKERFFSGRYERALLPGVGHFPQREDPDATTRAILDWLR